MNVMPDMTNKLQPCHIEYLTSEGSLTEWAGFSLQQRCKLFHRRFPEKKLTIYMLRKVYRSIGIKKKKIKNTEIISN